MDLGIIFNQVVGLFMHLWNASFLIYGNTFTFGQVFTYGLFLTVVIAFIKFLRE